MKIRHYINPHKFLDTKTRIWIGVVIALLLGNVIMTIQTAATGAELAKLETSSQKLMQTNRVLSDELVNDSSLTAIGKRAQDLGFAKPSQLLYLKSAEPVAQLP